MTQQNKNRLLVAGFIVLLILSYRFSISKTIETKQALNAIENEAIGFDDMLSMNLSFKQRERNVDSILNKSNLDNTSIQNNLLDVLNAESAKGLFRIEKFESPHAFSEKEVTITSYIFNLQGSYEQMEDILYQLEQKYNFGQIVHVGFERKRDYRKRKDYLECTVIVENFVSIN
mgnify:CR=1 FL=1